jgi:hypothetical protein
MERILLVVSLALGALLYERPAAAITPEFQISPRAGLGSLRLDEFVGFSEDDSESDTYGIGIGVGFLTPIGIVAEIGADSFGDFDFFDSFDSVSLSQEYLSVGYQAELGDGWRLVPRVGRARWKLRSEEGRLFNPGPEEEREIRGYNYFWEIGVSRRVSRVVTLGMNYRQGQYEFGRTRSAAFVVTLGF